MKTFKPMERPVNNFGVEPQISHMDILQATRLTTTYGEFKENEETLKAIKRKEDQIEGMYFFLILPLSIYLLIKALTIFYGEMPLNVNSIAMGAGAFIFMTNILSNEKDGSEKSKINPFIPSLFWIAIIWFLMAIFTLSVGSTQFMAQKSIIIITSANLLLYSILVKGVAPLYPILRVKFHFYHKNVFNAFLFSMAYIFIIIGLISVCAH